MNYVFMGSSSFSVVILKILHEEGGYHFKGVFTAPPRPQGRGYQIKKTLVHQYAQERGWPVYTPSSLKKDQKDLIDLAPDLIVVASYGLILPSSVLDIPKKGCVNVHPSLLPRWRGASPIPFTILNGDEQCGISLMKLDSGMDTGDIIWQEAYPLHKDMTTGELSHALATKGAHSLIKYLPAYLSDQLKPYAQAHKGITYAPKITKEEAFLDWSEPAIHLKRKIFAFQPWPGTWGFINGYKIHMLSAHIGYLKDMSLPVGTPVIMNKTFGIACGSHSVLCPTYLKPENGKKMDVEAFLCGYGKLLQPVACHISTIENTE